jgi:chloride channel protein, CIC family
MGQPPSAWLRRLRGLRHAADVTLARRFGLATREDRLFLLLIGLVGVIAGTLGSLVHSLITLLQRLLWNSDTLVEAARAAPWWVVVATPALGGLVVGLIFHLARERQQGGGGMSQLIEAVTLTGGKVPPRPVLASALAAVVTVGSGGSLGREGPMIRLGAMISSWLGSRMGMAPHRLKILVGCGAAAGLAAAYNIPIGGALFAMEVVLGNFALEIFGPIVASSVISTLIARAVQGDLPRYAAPGYVLRSGWEIPVYVGLGLLGAFVSVLFILSLRFGRGAFARLAFVPRWLRPALGMGMLGGLALEVPQVLGGGYGLIATTLADQSLSLQMLLLLAFAKLAATVLTSGSGGSGGLFTPSLFVGAMLGGAYGYSVHAVWPGLTSSYGAYAAVGMAAVAAGTSHAPISAILILFEFTGNYGLILPLMVAAITSGVVSRRLLRTSIYTESLARRGIDPTWRMEEAVLAGLSVGDLVRADDQILAAGDPYARVVERFLATRRQRLFVVGEGGRLVGSISLHDIKHSLEHPERLTAVLAHDLMLPVEQVLTRDERLHRAAQVFARCDFERLPVVEAGDARYAGVLAKRDLLAVYAQEVLGRPAMLATFVSGNEARERRDYVELPPDFALRLVALPAEHAGKTLGELQLPQALGVQVLEIKRRKGSDEAQRVVPDGRTLMAPGDLLIVLGPTATVDALQQGRWTAPPARAPEAPSDEDVPTGNVD